MKSVIFLAFANDKTDYSRYLRNLSAEYHAIRDTLIQAKTKGLCEYEILHSASFEHIHEVFTRKEYRNRIAVFHFSGHADGFQLMLENKEGDPQKAHGKGLVDYFKTLKTQELQENLQVLFFNGCCTENFAQELQNTIPCVIATSNSILDIEAKAIAADFYENLCQQISVGTAFDLAKNQRHIERGEKLTPFYHKKLEKEPSKLPWELYATDEGKNWKISPPDIEGVLRIDQAFIQKMQAIPSEKERIKAFYLAQNPNHLQFWGIIQDLGVKHDFEDEFFEQIKQNWNSSKPIIGRVVGSGGTGKTTFLRQIALRWVSETQKTAFWIGKFDYELLETDEWLQHLPADSLIIADEALDNWGILKTWLGKTTCKWITASRNTHKDMDLRANATRQDFDRIDMARLNQKLGEKLHNSLAMDTLNHQFSVKPFPFLFVLLRTQKENLSLIRDVQQEFEEIIQDDLQRMGEDLANALRTFAYIFVKYKTNLTNLAFQDLAKESFIKTTPAETAELLSYYLAVFENEKDRRKKIQETLWIFQKEDLAESISKTLDLQTQHRCAQETENLIDGTSQWTASTMLFLLGKEKQKDQAFLRKKVETLLEKRNTHHSYMNLVTHKNNFLQLNEQERWAYIEQFLTFAEGNKTFPKIIFSQKGGELTKQKAKEFLEKENQVTDVICKCLEILGKTDFTQQKAREFLGKEQYQNNPFVLTSALHILGKSEEGKKWATELLNKNQDHQVISVCLEILGAEAKPQAIKLLEKENQDKEVLCKCLEILGAEAKPQARILLEKENQDKEVLCKCLEILGAEAKPQATKLLEKENQDKEVLCKCLEILGSEAKPQARILLEKDNQDFQVLCKCLEVLGAEAKPQAIKLLEKENQDYQTICKCLEILGAEAKEQAKKLLEKENQVADVICKCLEILGKTPETEKFALKILNHWEKENFNVVLRSLTTLPDQPQSIHVVENIVRNGSKNFYQYSKILFQPFPKSKLWKNRVEYILQNWQNQNPLLVHNCLNSYAYNLPFTKSVCEGILENWQLLLVKEQQKPKGTFAYIFRAFAHPSLRDLAHRKAQEVLQKGKDSVGEGFYALAENIVQKNEFPVW